MLGLQKNASLQQSGSSYGGSPALRQTTMWVGFSGHAGEGRPIVKVCGGLTSLTRMRRQCSIDSRCCLRPGRPRNAALLGATRNTSANICLIARHTPDDSDQSTTARPSAQKPARGILDGDGKGGSAAAKGNSSGRGGSLRRNKMIRVLQYAGINRQDIGNECVVRQRPSGPRGGLRPLKPQEGQSVKEQSAKCYFKSTTTRNPMSYNPKTGEQ